MKKTIILVDGHNLLFRMFYGIPASIKNSKGKEIKGLIGFIGSLKRLVEEFSPYSLIVIFDSETSRNTNLEIEKTYKLSRTDYNEVSEEENPFSQLPLIKKALDYLNILNIEVNNNEADDYISSIIKSHNNNKYIIVSTDTDFIQLINNNTYLYIPRGKNSILYSEKEIIDKYHISPNKYVTFKSLTGDNSDNIKGINGIGNITAAKILQYNSIEDYIKNNPNTKISNLLINNKEIIEKNQQLISLNKDIKTNEIIFNKISKKINQKTYEIIEKINEK